MPTAIAWQFELLSSSLDYSRLANLKIWLIWLHFTRLYFCLLVYRNLIVSYLFVVVSNWLFVSLYEFETWCWDNYTVLVVNQRCWDLQYLTCSACIVVSQQRDLRCLCEQGLDRDCEEHGVDYSCHRFLYQAMEGPIALGLDRCVYVERDVLCVYRWLELVGQVITIVII